MASIFDQFKYGGHGVAESTLMLATMSGGHFYNMVHETDDIDNGSVLQNPTPEKWTVNDCFEATKAAVTDKIVLVLQAPKIYPEYTKLMQDESNFYNAAGEIMRAYEVYEGDRFSLNKDAFDTDADPKKGSYVKVKANSYKLTTDTSEPGATEAGFIGYILKENANGTFDIFVKQNKKVA